jgi:hypothetical protein
LLLGLALGATKLLTMCYRGVILLSASSCVVVTVVSVSPSVVFLFYIVDVIADDGAMGDGLVAQAVRRLGCDIDGAML